MANSFPILLMLAPGGASKAERWVNNAQRAAALDLVDRLHSLEISTTLFAIAAAPDDQSELRKRGVQVASSPSNFHFGRVLTSFASEHGFEHMAYFGGASAPLLEPETIMQAMLDVASAQEPYAVVNNLHSSDWAIFNGAACLHASANSFPTDNPLGWVLQQEGGYRVRALPADAASRVDIDTPSDLLVLSAHPGIGPNLARFLQRLPDETRNKVQRIGDVLTAPGSSLGVIGRGSSSVWRELERRTQIWIRMFVEERGMLASGRQSRGEVQSLMAMMLEEWGADRFIAEMGQMVDAVLWDTRVWMAHCGIWPPAGERFASDLGWYEQIDTPALKALTKAVSGAQKPFLVGGHGVVAGNVFALLEAFGL